MKKETLTPTDSFAFTWLKIRLRLRPYHPMALLERLRWHYGRWKWTRERRRLEKLVRNEPEPAGFSLEYWKNPENLKKAYSDSAYPKNYYTYNPHKQSPCGPLNPNNTPS